MNLDVVDLRSFYAERLGHITERLISHRLRTFWPDMAGISVLGLGYATPYLAGFTGCERRLAFMPAAQGVMLWPTGEPNAAALVLDDALPLPNGMVDRALLIHVLEGAENPREVLREVWRVLAPGGRLLVVVANRRGIWAHVESTPFGVGQPFSRSQLATLLRDTQFSPTNWMAALALPPVRRLLRTGAFWDRLGASLWPGFSGVLIVEATKLLYQTVAATRRQRERALGPIFVPPAPAGTRG